jgi:hypothetical protein
MNDKALDFDGVRAAALHEQWDVVDKNLEPLLNKELFEWALQALRKDQNRNTRDLAATILDRTTFRVSRSERQFLVAQMMDRTEYHIVRFRLAIALFQRNIRVPRVMKTMVQASKDPDLGERARSCLSGKS